MLVAISGGTGFLGSATAMALKAQGDCRVRLLTRVDDGVLVADEVVVGDIADERACGRFVVGADVVIHAAGLVRSTDIDALDRVNIVGTRSLLNAARRAGIRRFVHVSSTGVYGHPGVRVSELSPRHPATPYERSKAMAEAEVLADGTGPEVIVIQPSNVIGVGAPRQPLRRFLANAQAGRLIVHAGAWTNYVGVRDVARVIVAATTAITAPPVLIVNVPMPLDEFTMLAGSAVGRPIRTIGLPRLIGRALAPIVGSASGHIASLERVRALVDQTRFVTTEQSWFEDQGLRLRVDDVLTEMAVEYDLAGQR